MNKCNSCKKCYNECYFNAIEWNNNKPKLKDFSCEGCGLCELICPTNTISLKKINNAKIGYSKTKYGFTVFSAQLEIGASGSGKVVYEVRKKATKEEPEILLIDSPAGVGCPVIASVTGIDYAIIVTEPTPSGLSDMQKAIDVVNHFNVPYGIIINKFDLNSEITNKLSNENVIAKIPFDKKFAKALVELTPIIEYEEKYLPIFERIIKKIK